MWFHFKIHSQDLPLFPYLMAQKIVIEDSYEAGLGHP